MKGRSTLLLCKNASFLQCELSPSLPKIAVVEKVSLALDVVEREILFSAGGSLDWDSLIRTDYRYIRKNKRRVTI